MQTTIVTGTRPNLVKAAPLIREFKKQKIHFHLVHTGQHYDQNMFQDILVDLELPLPDKNFQAMHSAIIERMAAIMIKFQDHCILCKPDLVIVLGDVDSTLAAALVANKMKIPLAHIEAGERSFNRSMPEEINRILVDNMSQYLFCASLNAKINLQGEGLLYRDFMQACGLLNKCYFVGNLMIDQLKYLLDKPYVYAVFNEPYAVLTLHRQENVDIGQNFEHLIEIVGKVSEKIRVFFPAHPRIKGKSLKWLSRFPNIIKLDPLPYSEFIKTIEHSRFIMTDSGGIQVESSYMGVPCLTLRNETEWPDTVMFGSNHLVNMIDDEDLLFCVDKIMAGEWRKSRFKETDLCKMNAAQNITNIIKRDFK